MAYFRELPEINYVSLLPNRNRNDERILVKNIFKRAKLREDLNQSITVFDYYQIEYDTRPDTVAHEVYGDSELDWIILITNNITNLRNQWPISQNDLHNYMIEKYGETGITGVHHYETTEVKDQYSRILLKAGLVVDPDYKFRYTYRGVGGSEDRTSQVIESNPVQVITNLAYEQRKNDAKRQIRILKPDFVSAIVQDLRNVMKYNRSTQYINNERSESYNPRVSGV